MGRFITVANLIGLSSLHIPHSRFPSMSSILYIVGDTVQIDQ